MAKAPSPALLSLAEKARERADTLGHRLEPWQRGISRRRLVAACELCGLWAVVATAPNEPPTTGSTLKVQCRGKNTAPAWKEARSTAHAGTAA